MTEDMSKSASGAIADEAKGLVKEVYADAVKPAATEIGKTAGGLVGLAMWPVNTLVEGIKGGLDRLRTRVGKKLERVPPERQLPAPPSLAAKVSLNYALLGDGDEVSELRGMFEDLLLCAMDSNTARTAHPAFVEMIAQLTQDEAWLLKSIDRVEYAASNVFERTKEGRRPLGIHTVLGRAVINNRTRRNEALTNLERLGILRIDWSETAEEGPIDELEAADEPDFDGDQIYGHGGRISGDAIWRTIPRRVRARSSLSPTHEAYPRGAGSAFARHQRTSMSGASAESRAAARANASAFLSCSSMSSRTGSVPLATTAPFPSTIHMIDVGESLSAYSVISIRSGCSMRHRRTSASHVGTPLRA